MMSLETWHQQPWVVIVQCRIVQQDLIVLDSTQQIYWYIRNTFGIFKNGGNAQFKSHNIAQLLTPKGDICDWLLFGPLGAFL